MTVRPYQLLLALLEEVGVGSVLASPGTLPDASVLLNDMTVFYVDAGSRGERVHADFYYLKLAVLARASLGGRVEERVYHPFIVAGNSVLPPVFLGRGSERVRQAAAYVVELAALLALSRQGHRVLGSDGVSASGKVLLVRHGPLLQMVHHYTSKPFIVDTSEAEKLLGYAGITDASLRRELLDESYSCSTSGGVDRNRVVLGLLAIAILYRLAEEASKGKYGVAGVVEDVTRSRHLTASLEARLVKSALDRVRSSPSPIGLAARLADELRDITLKSFNSSNGELIASCLNADPVQLHEEADSRSEWDQLTAVLSHGLVERFNLSLADAGLDELETVILWAGLAPDVGDSELLYTLHYLAGHQGFYPVTIPMRHSARLMLARYYLAGPGGRARCYGEDTIDDRINMLARIVFQYIAPSQPPTCAEIESALKGRGLRGVSPYEVAQFVSTPPAIRVEYVNGMPTVDELLALTVYPSQLVLYGYPPQLLVVDRFSRVLPSETLAFRGLIESLVERVQPYTSFVRGWETRVAYMA